MTKKAKYIVIAFALVIFASCKKSGGNSPVTPDPNFTVISAKIDGRQVSSSHFASTTPIVTPPIRTFNSADLPDSRFKARSLMRAMILQLSYNLTEI